MEAQRIAAQLRHAFTGDPWHGSNISILLDGVTPEAASAHPVSGAHSIWELVLHTAIYLDIATEAIRGTPMPRLYETGADWLPLPAASPGNWASATSSLFEKAERLASAIEAFPDERLTGIAPGRDYDFYYLFHGIVQHSLYHAGQIGLLRRAQKS